jgi:probable FeS assembly SUF system protein SufT
MAPDRYTPVALERDCDVTLIPGGQRLRLHQGDLVVVTQALGGTFTVQTDLGHLARIDAADVDALGADALAEAERAAGSSRTAGSGDADAPSDAGGVPEASGPFDLDEVIERLKTVFDPEIPVNVVDLGLVYSCEAQPLAGGGHRVEIKMSMTAPGCGMGDILGEDARTRVLSVPGVTEVDVELVWDPPWDMSRMSEAARLELGML